MTTSAFEILGPIMVGPSSSHTAGALRLASIAKSLAMGKIKFARFKLYNSFSQTYKGHGTDRALVAGLLGFDPDDTRVKDSFAIADKEGLGYEFVEAGENPDLHPNTVEIEMECEGGTITVSGASLGGGRVELSSINGVEVEISGAYPTIFIAHIDQPGVLSNLTRIISESKTNVATMRNYRKAKGGDAYTIFETDEMPQPEVIEQLKQCDSVKFIAIVQVPGAASAACASCLTLNFENGKELLALCKEKHLSIGELMRQREFELAAGQYNPDQRMQKVLDVIKDECVATINKPERSLGGLLYGQARAVAEDSDNLARSLMGETQTKAVAYAMAVLERSATMGVIVAAPTAGSAGVVPGACLALAEDKHLNDEQLMMGLWTTCALGAILARNASVSGAEGGCQAEVGSASAMAAAALVELLGGTCEQAISAASIAIGNLLGLVCDPVRGLVEYPCQNRNAIGVANAYSAAQIALSCITNPIPFDEVVEAMKKVGQALPTSLRETAQGGLAACKSAETARCKGCISCSGMCQ